MINHYTANRKVRNDDAYSPGGRIGRRPDRATLAYCQRAREAYHGVPVIAGGVEASLRRLAHYDYWSDKVRRSIMLDCQGRPVGLRHGRAADRRNRPSACRRRDRERFAQPARRGLSTGARSVGLPDPPWPATARLRRASVNQDSAWQSLHQSNRASVTPTRQFPRAFAEMTNDSAHNETNPYNAKRLVQFHGPRSRRRQSAGPAAHEAEMDRVYGLPYTRRPHPSYGDEQIPAYEVVKDSVQIMRGCFGGCTFCSITAHEGRIIQSRSQESVLAEIGKMADRARVHRRGQRHRRPDGQHVPDALHAARGRSRLPPAELRASDDLQAAGHRSRPARRTDAKSPRESPASRKCSSPPASAWTWPAAIRSTCANWPRITSAAI